MVDQQIHILGDEEIVSTLGLLGLEGSIIYNEKELLKKFIDLTKNPTIGMIIIALPLTNEIIEYLLDFKQNNRSPFVFIMPDIFAPNIEKEDPILNKIFNAIGDIFLM